MSDELRAITREEKILKAMATNSSVEDLKATTRKEKILKEMAKNGVGGGGVSSEVLDGIISQLNDIVKRQDEPVLVGTNFVQIKSKDYDQVFDISTLDKKIQGSLYYNFDCCWIATEIKPTRQQCLAFVNETITEDELELKILPDIDYLKQMINKINENNIKIMGIKFHNNWIEENYSKLTPTKILNKYFNFINEVLDDLELKCDYVTVLNESPTIYKDINSQSIIADELNTIKVKGYKVGLCGVDWNNLPCDLIMNATDLISVHSYPKISGKMENTTLEDCLISWELTGLKERLTQINMTYPNKEIMLLETGVQNLWEALFNPEIYLPKGTISVDNKVQRLYFESLLRYIKDVKCLKGFFTWYFDYKEYDLMKELFDNRLKGGI